jgi:hypothetical protein
MPREIYAVTIDTTGMVIIEIAVAVERRGVALGFGLLAVRTAGAALAAPASTASRRSRRR